MTGIEVLYDMRKDAVEGKQRKHPRVTWMCYPCFPPDPFLLSTCLREYIPDLCVNLLFILPLTDHATGALIVTKHQTNRIVKHNFVLV